MVTWAKIALLLLQVVNRLLIYLQHEKLIDEGYQKRIAEEAAQILKSNQYARQVMSNVNKLSDADTDALLRALEPK